MFSQTLFCSSFPIGVETGVFLEFQHRATDKFFNIVQQREEKKEILKLKTCIGIHLKLVQMVLNFFVCEARDFFLQRKVTNKVKKTK